MEIPKISNITETRHILDVDWLAKAALSDDEYRQYKSKDIKDPSLAEKIKRNFTLQQLLHILIPGPI